MRDIAALSSVGLSIADKKNSELHALSGLVTQSQFDVARKQAILTSLQAKASHFGQVLAQADADQQAALANLNLGKDVLSSASSLAVNMKKATGKCAEASNGATTVARDMAKLVGKLILAVEFINKVGQLVNKQKSNNPMVPDKLVENMSKAATAANNAVALTLTALQSCYLAEATLLESRNVLALGATQSQDLSTRMTSGWNAQSGKVTLPGVDGAGAGVVALLQQAYDDAKGRYSAALAGKDIVTKQLSHAQLQLDDAMLMLNSYQSGLAAATAACAA